MSNWRDLTDDELWKQIRVLLNPPIPYEDDPLTDSERELGLRFFTKGIAALYAKDLGSGTVGGGKNAQEAIGDLRSKIS